MCDSVARLSSGGNSVAVLISLCADRREHLSTLLATDDSFVSPAELLESAVFKACVDACERATHALVELDYFDADHRSNAAPLVATRHQPSELRTDRLLFVETQESLASTEPPDLLGFLDTADVFGYIVLTPDPTGPVGRSLLPPPADIYGVLSGVNPGDHVRTGVHEIIAVFGSLHDISGIPFVQQDGSLFRCAHASAWIVHYSAVLRGLCARRSSVDFHTDLKDSLLFGRQFPSAGLTAWQLATMFEHFRLPAEYLTILELAGEGRMADWYDRGSIWELSSDIKNTTGLNSPELHVHLESLNALKMEGEDHEQAAADTLLEAVLRFWTRENLTRTICQYLNSGFPCVLVGHVDQIHTTVITGYLRRRDLSDDYFSTERGSCTHRRSGLHCIG